MSIPQHAPDGLDSWNRELRAACGHFDTQLAFNRSLFIGEIHNLLHIASEKYQDADGFVNVSSSGLYIKRVKPDFNVRAYGYSKLPELLAAFPNKYQIKRYEGKGGATIIAYKCL